jgi:tetratricopeptide (TPR) repeat protein
LQILGIVERLAGQPAAAEDALRRSYDLLDAAGDTAHRSSAAALLADALYDLGRDDEAEGFTIVCEEIGAAEDLATQMRWRATRAKILARRGAQAEALSLVHEAERIGRRSELYVFADVLTDAAHVLAAAGRMDEATAAVDEAIALAARKGDTVSAARAQALRSLMQPLGPP